jgi:hypothetical protein
MHFIRLIFSFGLITSQELRQLGNIHGNAPRVIERQHASDIRLVGRLASG